MNWFLYILECIFYSLIRWNQEEPMLTTGEPFGTQELIIFICGWLFIFALGVGVYFLRKYIRNKKEKEYQKKQDEEYFKNKEKYYCKKVESDDVKSDIGTNDEEN